MAAATTPTAAAFAIAAGPEASPITMPEPRTIRQNAARVDRTNVVFMSRLPYVCGISRLHGPGPRPWVPAGLPATLSPLYIGMAGFRSEIVGFLTRFHQKCVCEVVRGNASSRN